MSTIATWLIEYHNGLVEAEHLLKEEETCITIGRDRESKITFESIYV